MFGVQLFLAAVGSVAVGLSVAAAGGDALGLLAGSLLFAVGVAGAIARDAADEADEEFDL